MRHWFIAAMLVLAVPISAPMWMASPAWADRKADCEDKEHPNVVISACTSIIDDPNRYRDRFSDNAVASAYANRGVAYHDLHNDEAALRDYTTSLKLEPSKITYFNRANLYFRRGEWSSVLSDANAGLKLGDASAALLGLLSSTDTLLTYFKGRALEELGTKTEAIIELRKAYHASASSTNDNLKDVHELSAKHLKAMGASTDTPSLFDFNPQGNPPRTNLPPIKPAPPQNNFPTSVPKLGEWSSVPPSPPSSSTFPYAFPANPKPAEPDPCRGLPNCKVVPNSALHDPETDRLWEQFDKQQREGTLDNQPPSTVPLSPSEINAIQQARKLQCMFRPELCR